MSPPKYVDLLALIAALAVFLLGGFSMLGYAVGALAWLAQRGIQMLAARHAAAELAAGNRRRVMGIFAATTLGRVWLVASAVLVVGLAERRAGLAAASLVAVEVLTPEGEVYSGEERQVSTREAFLAIAAG
jgi:hypothetical protein